MFVNHNFAVPAAHSEASITHAGMTERLVVDRIDATEVAGSSDAALVAGECIAIHLPGVGAVEARVISAGRRRFTAELLARDNLRLKMLSGWTASY